MKISEGTKTLIFINILEQQREKITSRFDHHNHDTKENTIEEGKKKKRTIIHYHMKPYLSLNVVCSQPAIYYNFTLTSST
jgi:hypothetical protein